jgi:hypothetical protein
MQDFVRTANVSDSGSSEEEGDEDLARVEPSDSMQGLIMSFNRAAPPAPILPERGQESPIHENEEEEELERDISRDISHVGSLPETLPVNE